MSEQIEILTALRKIFIAKKDIKLINVYKGVPISFAGRVASVSNESVLLHINKYQTVCIKQVHYTYMRDALLAQVVRADITTLDFAKNLAVASFFSYAGTTIGDRTQIRVEPEEGLPVVISNGIYSKAEVINLSIRGLGILIDQGSFTTRAFGVGQHVDLRLALPIINQAPINLSGVVKSVNPIEYSKKFRLGIQTFPDAPVELILSKYVTQRQAEILREIKSLYLMKK